MNLNNPILSKYSVKFSLLVAVYFISSTAYGQLRINTSQKNKPYTFLPDNIGETYRFAIIGDLTGGEEAGVFDYAIQRINELAPDFVISIGDLIEGYTKDQEVINAQWKVFNNSLSKLEVPFFYISGNHDVGNPTLQQDWNTRFGTSYYTFTVNADLFVILNTFEPDVDGISKEQAKYLKEQIINHPEGNRLFVFSHDPLWRKFDKPGIRDLAPLLQERNTTYFCGHEHRYLNKTYLNQKHYMLAGVATGGPGMKGIELGEYHNLMFATSSSSKFSLSNIQLEGLLPLDIVNNDTEKQVAMALSGRWANIIPTVSDSQFADKFESILTLNNTGDYPFYVSGKFKPIDGAEFIHEKINYILVSGEKKQIPITLSLAAKSDILQMPEVILELQGRFDQPNIDIESSSTVRWILDNIHQCKSIEEAQYIYCNNFGDIDESWDWHGIKDGSLLYKVGYDKKNIYIEIESLDDILLTNSDNDAVQDKISIFFTSDTTSQVKDFAQFDFIANSKVKLNNNGKLKIRGFTGTCSVKANSLVIQLTIPRKYAPKDMFRLNFSFLDIDNPKEIDPSVLWWKPSWKSSKDYPFSGVFVIE